MLKQSTACQQGKINMLNTKWNWDDAKRIWQEEAREEGYEEGLKEAREEGRKEVSLETAKKALSKGLPLEIIQELTGLDAETISSLGPAAKKNN
jgi:predicted transposase/invertase (TIGR01784 family)